MKKGLILLGGGVLLAAVVVMFTFSNPKGKDEEDYEKNFNNQYRVFSLSLPKDMNFAGEKVPVEIFDVRERLDRELIVNTYWQSNTLLLHKRANRWFPLIESIMKKNGIPEDFKYVCLIESGLLNVISPSAAVGYWQFLENTGKGYGLEINDEVDERYNVEKATEAACKYFLEAKRTLGSWTLAAASYNMGIGGVKKQLEKQRVKSYYDLWLVDETFRYVFRILAAKEIISHPDKYGYNLRKQDLYPALNTYTVSVDSSITDLVAFSEKFKMNYKTLKLLNPWLRQPYLMNKSRKRYNIWISRDSNMSAEELASSPYYGDSSNPQPTAPASDLVKPSAKKITHVVGKGETLNSIAKKYSVSLDKIMEWNSLKEPKGLKKGESLIIMVQ